jgi:hypothetical protein
MTLSDDRIQLGLKGAEFGGKRNKEQRWGLDYMR